MATPAGPPTETPLCPFTGAGGPNPHQAEELGVGGQGQAVAMTLTRPLGGRGGPGLCRGGRTEAPAIARPGTMKRARTQLLRRRIQERGSDGNEGLEAHVLGRLLGRATKETRDIKQCYQN